MNATALPHRDRLKQIQLDRINRQLQKLHGSNRFYTRKLDEAGIQLPFSSLQEFCLSMPFTTKQELVEDQLRHPLYGSNLTEPLENYVRFHQTSGTTSKPLRWLDTAESWGWVVDNWVQVFQSAGVTAKDTVFLAFSFGPFLGFWAAMDAAEKIGCLCIAGGGMSSLARLNAILENRVTVLCCTPTYALRLATVAMQQSVPIHESSVHRIIVAGEPGGSLPAVRQQIESTWKGGRVYDHHGMTEVGPVSFETHDHPGVLHVIESSYFAEVIDPHTSEPVSEGERGELIITTLGRSASPLLRYRTGDLVEPSWKGESVYGRNELALIGGILGRIDDMVTIRGVNVFPSLIDETVRSCGGIAEYQVIIEERNSLAEMIVQIEPLTNRDGAEVANRIATALNNLLQLRVPVEVLQPESLPRFEMKAKRWNRR